MRTGVSFTWNDPIHAQSVMDAIYEQNPNPNIYVNICGRFAPEQKIIEQNIVKYDVREHKKMYEWFKKNNRTYDQEPDVQNMQNK